MNIDGTEYICKYCSSENIQVKDFSWESIFVCQKCERELTIQDLGIKDE